MSSDEPTADVQNLTGTAALPFKVAEVPTPVEEVAAEPPKLHPSASEPVSDEDRDQHGPYFIGYWNEQPLFGCPYCPWSVAQDARTPNGGDATEFHVLASVNAGSLAHQKYYDDQQEGA